MSGTSPALATAAVPNDFLYNGKEFHNDLNLGLYDYGFRWYDPAVARFVSVDPLAESFYYLTTYQYASNSPIQNIDLDGLEGLHYMETLNDDSQRHVIEKNVIVLTQAPEAIPRGASEGKIRRINRRNARLPGENRRRVEGIRVELESYFNGDDGQAMNTNREAVRFQFNIIEMEVDNTNTVENPGRTALNNGLEGAPANFAVDGNIPNQNAPAAIITTNPTTQSRVRVGVLVEVDDSEDAPPGSTAHEIGHTLMTRGQQREESRPDTGGLMVEPPRPIKPFEVNKMLEDSIERN